MRNTIFQPRQTLITADWLNAVDNAVFNGTQIISPATFGAVGDGITDDYIPLNQLLSSIKKLNLDLSTPSSAKAALRGLPRIQIDLAGNTYATSKQLVFSDLYNVEFVNGVIKAIGTLSSWGTTPVVYVGKVKATDIYHDQTVRFCTFRNFTIDGNSLASCVYLENTFSVSFELCLFLGWPNTGYGLKTSSSADTPNKSNTHLRLLSCSGYQIEPAEKTTPGGGAVYHGTAFDIQSADFFIDGLVAAYCDVCLSLDNMYNGQVHNFHPYCANTQKCLYLGPNAHHIAFTNIYTDTGIVEIRSFDHTFSSAHFIAGSQVNFVATNANEIMDGLYMGGALFANPPSYLTEGSGSFSSNLRGRVFGALTTGGPSGAIGPIIAGAQSATRVSYCLSDGTTIDYSSGWFRSAADHWGYSTKGVQQFDIDDTGRLVFGYTSALQTAASASSRIQLNGTGIADASLSATRWSTTAAAQPQLTLARSHSGTVGTFSAVQSGDYLGRVAFAGDSGSSLNPVGATIRAQATANWTTSSSPAAIYLQTTPSGSTTPLDRWSIDQTGALSPVSPSYAFVLPGPYANDSAAATAGVPVNGAYRVTGGAVAWRQV